MAPEWESDCGYDATLELGVCGGGCGDRGHPLTRVWVRGRRAVGVTRVDLPPLCSFECDKLIWHQTAARETAQRCVFPALGSALMTARQEGSKATSWRENTPLHCSSHSLPSQHRQKELWGSEPYAGRCASMLMCVFNADYMISYCELSQHINHNMSPQGLLVYIFVIEYTFLTLKAKRGIRNWLIMVCSITCTVIAVTTITTCNCSYVITYITLLVTC